MSVKARGAASQVCRAACRARLHGGMLGGLSGPQVWQHVE